MAVVLLVSLETELTRVACANIMSKLQGFNIGTCVLVSCEQLCPGRLNWLRTRDLAHRAACLCAPLHMPPAWTTGSRKKAAESGRRLAPNFRGDHVMLVALSGARAVQKARRAQLTELAREQFGFESRKEARGDEIGLNHFGVRAFLECPLSSSVIAMRVPQISMDPDSHGTARIPFLEEAPESHQRKLNFWELDPPFALSLGFLPLCGRAFGWAQPMGWQPAARPTDSHSKKTLKLALSFQGPAGRRRQKFASEWVFLFSLVVLKGYHYWT